MIEVRGQVSGIGDLGSGVRGQVKSKIICHLIIDVRFCNYVAPQMADYNNLKL